MIGAEPHTEWLAPTVARDEKGFVLTGRDISSKDWPLQREPYPFETSRPGIFAARGRATRIDEASRRGGRRGLRRGRVRPQVPGRRRRHLSPAVRWVRARVRLILVDVRSGRSRCRSLAKSVSKRRETPPR